MSIVINLDKPWENILSITTQKILSYEEILFKELAVFKFLHDIFPKVPEAKIK